MNTPDRNSQHATIKTVLVLDDDVLVFAAFEVATGKVTAAYKNRRRRVHLATTPRSVVESALSGMNTPDRNSQHATIKTVLVLDDDVLVFAAFGAGACAAF
jgi:hypothetical protein